MNSIVGKYFILDNYNLDVLSFKIVNDKQYPILNNLNYLRVHIWETLIFTMLVRPTRISDLLVDRAGDDFLVTFTLLDAPPRTGPVENIFNETSLDTLVDRLTNLIDTNSLVFRARSGTKPIMLRAAPKSLNFVYDNTKTNTITNVKAASSNWGTFIAIGIVVGIIIATVAFVLLTRK
jgi:hypothetical protein